MRSDSMRLAGQERDLGAAAQGPDLWPPWSATLLAFVSSATLFMSMGKSYTLLVLGALLLGSRVFRFRIPDQNRAPWIIRFVIYGIIMSGSMGHRGYVPNVYNDDFVQMVGMLAAAEVVVQCWMVRPWSGSRAGPMILLSCVEYLASVKTYDSRIVTPMSPVFIVLLVVSLRTLRPRVLPLERRPRIWLGWAPTLGALAAALLIGATGSHLVFVYRGALNQWGIALFNPAPLMEAIGISATPHLGDGSGFEGSPARVLRVSGDMPDGYLRGMAFSTYQGGEWGPALGERAFGHDTPGQLHSTAIGKIVQISRLVDSFRLLCLPLGAAGIDPGPDVEVEGLPGTGPLRTRTWVPPPYTYTVVMAPIGNSRDLLCPPPAPAERLSYLALPSNLDPRVRTLAQSIGGDKPDARMKILAVQQYLMSNYKYSLNVHPGAGDPVTNFLMKRLSAHCEYFASATVLLLRCLGVPTRYVTGYYAHEVEAPGMMVVRQRDAHAWAESWVEGRGWVTVDSTPGDGRPDKAYTGLSPWERVWERLQDFLAAVRERLVDQAGRGVGFAVFGVGLLGGLSLIIRRTRRRHSPQDPGFSYSSADAEIAGIEARFATLMKWMGMACPPATTWREYLASVPDESLAPNIRSQMPAMLRFIDSYDPARFGCARGAAEIEQIRAEIDQLELECGLRSGSRPRSGKDNK